MRQLRITLVVAVNDLRRRVRNRSAIFLGVIGPLALAVVFGSLIGGASTADFTIGIVDADRTAVTRDLVSTLVADLDEQSDGRLQVVEVASAEQAEQRLNDDDLSAVMMFPEGFAAAATSGGSAGITVLRDPRQPVSGQVAESLASTIATGFERVGLSLATLGSATQTAPTAEDIAAARRTESAVIAGSIPVGGRELSPAAFFGASMAILFLFMSSGLAARSVLTERRSGTLARALATPASPGAVIAGKTLSVGLLGIIGFTIVWLVTQTMFDAPWGAAPAVLALIVATVLAITGMATFVASLARSERQADSLTSAVSFVLALLGGNFVGPNLPTLLRRLSVITPNGWSLRGFTELATGSAGFAELGVTLAVLGVFAVTFGAAGVARVRRVMVR